MKIIEDVVLDAPKVSNNTTIQPDTLSKLLGEYPNPAITENDIQKESEQQSKQIPSEANDVPSLSGSQWQGNPLYFQSGKKAGQLKPLGNKPRLQYVKTEDVSTIDGELITGALFLTLIDLVFPLLISAAHNYFAAKSGKIKPDDLMLTAEQKRQLSPIADKVVKQLKLSANPNTVLILTMAGLYGMQYAVARLELKAKEEKKKAGL